MENGYDARKVAKAVGRRTVVELVALLAFVSSCAALLDWFSRNHDRASMASLIFFGATLGALCGFAILSLTMLYVGRRIARSLERFSSVIIAGFDRAAANRGDRPITDDVRFSNDI